MFPPKDKWEGLVMLALFVAFTTEHQGNLLPITSYILLIAGEGLVMLLLKVMLPPRVMLPLKDKEKGLVMLSPNGISAKNNSLLINS